MKTYTKTHTLPYRSTDTLPAHLEIDDSFPDHTPYTLTLTEQEAIFHVSGQEEIRTDRQDLLGIWSIETEEAITYQIFVELSGRQPKEAFLEQEGKLYLQSPHLLSPADWQKLAGGFHRLGYDTRDGNDARMIFTRLTNSGRNVNRIGYRLQPDQQEAVLSLFFKTKTQTFDQKLADKAEKLAVKTFGTTNTAILAGYLTPHGHLLNFSCQGYQRDRDHRVIGDLMNQLTGQDKSAYDQMMAFMALGNIRLQACGLHIIQPPTTTQRRALGRILARMDDETQLDVSNESGRHTDSLTFPLGTSPNKIFQAIDRYFETGFLTEGEPT